MSTVTLQFPPRVARTAAALACGLALALPGALASGTRVGFKDAFATGRGNAFVATADNPSAVYYNPAGLTQLDGTQLAGNIYAVAVSSDYAGAGGKASINDSYQYVPSFYASWKPRDTRWAFGAGVYAPFGLSTDWPASSPLRTFALHNKETYLTFNLSAAYQLTPELAIGGGLTYNRVSVDLSRAIGVFGPNDLFRFRGDGTTAGYTLGALWKPSAQHSFGFDYVGRTTADLHGTTDTIPLITGESSSATLPFPDYAVLGYSYRPTPDWNLEVNLDWTNWSRLNTVTIVKPSGNTALPFDWQPGFFYAFGATRYLPGGWYVSAGYLYTANSTPDATYTPAVPDSNRSFYSLGTGYNSGNLSAHLAWQYADGGTRTVTGSPPSLIGATADGTYRNSLNGLSFSFELRY